jgi:cytochrome c-type biogenesis protein
VPTYGLIVAGMGMSRVDRREGEEWAAGLLPLAFLIGFSGLFVVLGANGTGLGWWVRGALPWLQVLGGLGVLLLGGWLAATRLRVDLPSGVWRRAILPLGVVIGTGVSAAWTPCIGPVLATILFAAGSPGLGGTGLLVVYTLGLSMPFLLVGLAAERLTRRNRALDRNRPAGVVLATLLVLVAVLMVTGRFGWLSATLSRFGPVIQLPI